MEYGANKPHSIIVREGEHLKMRCAANGFPLPNIEWMREDGRAIAIGAWQISSMPGHTLNITKVNRIHMGLYRCIADNGIWPQANQTFQLDVYCKYLSLPLSISFFHEISLFFPQLFFFIEIVCVKYFYDSFSFFFFSHKLGLCVLFLLFLLQQLSCGMERERAMNLL